MDQAIDSQPWVDRDFRSRRRGFLRTVPWVLCPLSMMVLLHGAWLAVPGRAETWTWDGGGANDNWSTTANWGPAPPSPPPVSDNDTLIQFAGAAGLTPNQNLVDGFQLNRLRFSSTAQSFVLVGSDLDFRTSSASVLPRISQDSFLDQVINLGLTLTHDTTVDGVGNLRINGTLAGTGDLIVSKPSGSMFTLGASASNLTGSLILNAGILRGAGRSFGPVVHLNGGELQPAVTVFPSSTIDWQTDLIVGGNARITLGLGHASVVADEFDSLSLGAHTLTFANDGVLPVHDVRFGSGTLTGNGAFAVLADVVVTMDGPVGQSGGSFGLSKSGDGTLHLRAGNSFSGNVVLSGGTLRADLPNSLGIAGSALQLSGDATLELRGAADAPYLRNTTVTGNATIRVGPAAIGPAFATLGTLSIGSQTLTLTPTIVAPNEAFGLTFAATTLTGNAHVVVNNNGTGPGTLRFGTVGGTGSLIKSGSGTLVLSGAATYSGSTTINDGVLRLQSASLPATSVVNLANVSGATLDLGGNRATLGGLSGGGSNGGQIIGCDDLLTINNTVATTFSGLIEGTCGLTKQGEGDLTLDADQGYTGPTIVSAGRLTVAGDSSSPAFSVSGGALRFTGTPKELGLTSVAAAADGVVEYVDATLYGGSLRGPGLHQAIAGSIPNTFSGTVVRNGAQLAINGTTVLNDVENHGQINAFSTTTWNGGSNIGGGVLNVQRTVNVSGLDNSGVLTINANGLGGVLNNTGSNLVSYGGARVTVFSGGQLNLLGGTTLELNGSLLVNNGTISGATNVNYGALAKGSGVFGPVNVTDGGTFSPGNSPGTTVTGAATWDDGGRYIFEIADAAGAPGTGWDLWQVNGVLDIAAGFTTNSRFTVSVASLLADGATPGPAANFNPSIPYAWPIAEATLGVTGFSPDEITIDRSSFANPLALGQFALATSGNALLLTYTPSTNLPGDIDLDGDVDRNDAALFSSYFGLGTASIWTTGDFNADGATTLADLALLQSHLGQAAPSPGPATVPEPAGLTLAALVLIVFVRKRQPS